MIGFTRTRCLTAGALLGLAIGCAGPPVAVPTAAAPDLTGTADAPKTEAAAAYDELLASLAEAQRVYLGPARRVTTAADVAEGHRYLMHLLQQGLVLEMDSVPSHPVFQRIVTPWRKVGGDNADAIYWVASLEPGKAYRVTGNQAGAVYSSLTIESGGQRGGYAERIGGVINDTQYEVGEDGSFEVFVGGPSREKNWIELPDDAMRIMSRHYFENETSAAADLELHVPMYIEVIAPGGPPPSPTDASIAEGIRRVNRHFRAWSLDQPIPDPMPTWVSTTPNQFNAPLLPGDMAYSAADAAYTQAPYAIGPDEALVMTGRFPEARFGNVTVWNRFIQSYDYLNRPISLNRAQVELEPDGSIRIVLAHRDPGVPNWLDTGGRPSGTIFWRFMLPEGSIETPRAEVVKFADVAR